MRFYGLDYKPDLDADEPYYYCEECRATYPASYTWLIPFEPFDWLDLVKIPIVNHN